MIEEGAGSLSRRLVECSAARAGARILDVGTGIGEPALTAAEAVGPSGLVVGLDRASAMLAIARERAQTAAHGAAKPARAVFLQGDAVALPSPDAAFDAAVCRWGLMHVPEPDAALAEVRRVLRPGGRLAAAVWGAPREVPFLSGSRDAVLRTLGLPAADPADGPFRMHDADELVARFERAGFLEAAAVDHVVELGFDSAAEYARFVFEISGWTRRAVATASPALRARVRAAVEAAALEHARPDGTIRFVNRASVVDARV